jgi:hypothetical protein
LEENLTEANKAICRYCHHFLPNGNICKVEGKPVIKASLFKVMAGTPNEYEVAGTFVISRMPVPDECPMILEHFASEDESVE